MILCDMDPVGVAYFEFQKRDIQQKSNPYKKFQLKNAFRI